MYFGYKPPKLSLPKKRIRKNETQVNQQDFTGKPADKLVGWSVHKVYGCNHWKLQFRS